MNRREQYRQARPHRWYGANTWTWGSILKEPKMIDAGILAVILVAGYFGLRLLMAAYR